MILLIDIGNTRIKWAQLIDGCIGVQSAAPHAQMDREQLAATILQPSAGAGRVLIANVGGQRIGELASSSVRAHCGIEAQFVQATANAGGVRNAYREPAKLGVDRWLAVIGAHAMEKRAACVVSIGTAMTIDGVDANGRHLGGVIAPGPDLMASSLFRNTSEIARRTEWGESAATLLADNTRDAVEQGAVHALAALIERVMDKMKPEVNETPSLILTGGASSRIEKALTIPFSVAPDLVLRGLAVLASAVDG